MNCFTQHTTLYPNTQMILYNVTIKIDASIHDEWVQWMKAVHIPEVMHTGLFTEFKMMRLLEQDESDGITFAIQYFSNTMNEYKQYKEKFAPALQKQASDRYEGKFVAFRTLMEVV